MNDPRRSNTNVHYSEAFCLKILDDIHSGRNTIAEVSLLYGIPKQTIYK
jgi:transposase-like protein